MLDTGELNRRLKALRVLRRYTQKGLEAVLDDRGLNKTDLGKVERGEKKLSPAMLSQLVSVLRAPADYFTEPDLDSVLFGSTAADALPAPPGELGLGPQGDETTPQVPGHTEPPAVAGGAGDSTG